MIRLMSSISLYKYVDMYVKFCYLRLIYIFIHEFFEEFLFSNYISYIYFIQSLLYKYYNSNRKK